MSLAHLNTEGDIMKKRSTVAVLTLIIGVAFSGAVYSSDAPTNKPCRTARDKRETIDALEACPDAANPCLMRAAYDLYDADGSPSTHGWQDCKTSVTVLHQNVVSHSISSESNQYGFWALIQGVWKFVGETPPAPTIQAEAVVYIARGQTCGCSTIPFPDSGLFQEYRAVPDQMTACACGTSGTGSGTPVQGPPKGGDGMQ